MKYYVAEKKDSYELRTFDNLTQAYKYYLEDAGKRFILKEIIVKVVEGGD